MKKIMICFLPIVLIAIGMGSCQKEELSNGKIRVKLERCHNNGAKVSFDLTNGFQWQSGDQIKVCRVSTSDVSQVDIGTYTIEETSVSAQSDYAVFSNTGGTDVTMSSGSTGDYYYAYYPASIRGTSSDIGQNALIIIPNTQAITSDGKMQEFPMYAQLGTGTGNFNFSFRNLCGILRLHLTGGANDMVSSITIATDESHPIAGTYTLQGANTQNPFIVTGSAVTSGEGSITINCPSSGLSIGSGRDFCIYLPTGDYPHMEITITRTDGKKSKKVFDGGSSKDAPTAINIARSRYTTITFDNLEFKAVFSIGENRTVIFSPGNLQYVFSSTSGEYRFASNDYEYIGSSNVTNLNNGSGVIDLFGWGTGANPTLNSANIEDYPTTFVDWGNYPIKASDGNTTYEAGIWHTLSQEEWQYLLNTRQASSVNNYTNARYAKAIVNGKKGLIIFPDKYVHPSGVTSPTNINVASNHGWNTTNGNIYTTGNWAAMKEAGAVFLPAAGYQNDRPDDYSSDGYYGNNTIGSYWTSTLYSTSNAVCLYIKRDNTDGFHINKTKKRGCSVRLVQDY